MFAEIWPPDRRTSEQAIDQIVLNLRECVALGSCALLHIFKVFPVFSHSHIRPVWPVSRTENLRYCDHIYAYTRMVSAFFRRLISFNYEQMRRPEKQPRGGFYALLLCARGVPVCLSAVWRNLCRTNGRRRQKKIARTQLAR